MRAVDKHFSEKANISVIRKHDPDVVKIVASASQVALYKFDDVKKRWEKRNIEGACFLYRRKGQAKYGVFILNRLDMNNYAQLLNDSMEVQLEAPFLLFKCSLNNVYSVWFYDVNECHSMASVFEKLLSELKLEKLNPPAIQTTETRVCEQSDSVREFFARAKLDTKSSSPPAGTDPERANMELHDLVRKTVRMELEDRLHDEKMPVDTVLVKPSDLLPVCKPGEDRTHESQLPEPKTSSRMTKRELLISLDHLLKTDPNAVEELHDEYKRLINDITHC